MFGSKKRMKKKMEHSAEKAEGTVKEKAGSATDDKQLEAEGRAKKTSADVKQAGDKAVDAADDATRN